MKQEFGLKGNIGKANYSAYYKLRTFTYTNHFLDTIQLPVQTSGTEQYLGGRIGFQLDSLMDFSGEAEFMSGGFYKIEAEIKSPWLDASFRNTLSKPGFLPQVYKGSYDYWVQSFSGINMTQAKGYLKVGRRAVNLKAGGAFTIMDHQVYFKEITPGADGQRVLPFQSGGNQIILSPEVSASIKFFRHFYFRPQMLYTSVIRNDDNIINNSVDNVRILQRISNRNRISNTNSPRELQIGARDRVAIRPICLWLEIPKNRHGFPVFTHLHLLVCQRRNFRR